MIIAEKYTINAQADKVWDTLKSFDYVEKYLPLVQKLKFKEAALEQLASAPFLNLMEVLENYQRR